MQEELLALLVEEVSIVAAGMQRRKPVQLPRPGQPSPAAGAGQRVNGFRGMAQLAASQGRVKTRG